MNLAMILLCSFGAGLLGAMGLGGGGVLLLALSFAGVGQLAAQGINLLFILPVGLVGLLLHRRAGLTDFFAALPVLLGGLPGVAVGALLALRIDEAVLSKAFGGLLLLIALREAFLGIRALRRRSDP